MARLQLKTETIENSFDVEISIIEQWQCANEECTEKEPELHLDFVVLRPGEEEISFCFVSDDLDEFLEFIEIFKEKKKRIESQHAEKIKGNE